MFILISVALEIKVVPVRAYMYTAPSKKNDVLTALNIKYLMADSLDKYDFPKDTSPIKGNVVSSRATYAVIISFDLAKSIIPEVE